MFETLFFILSAALTFYTYFASQKAPDIVFSVGDQIQVFDSDAANNQVNTFGTGLIVVDSGGQRFNQNIYAAEIKVWNCGGLSLKPEDVRTPLHISVDSSLRVLSASVTHSTNGNVDKFSVDQKLGLHWAYFDPGEGFAIKLIYSSKTLDRLTVSGRIAGGTGPTDGLAIGKSLTASALSVIRWALFVVVALFAVTILLSLAARKLESASIRQVMVRVSEATSITSALVVLIVFGSCILVLATIPLYDWAFAAAPI